MEWNTGVEYWTGLLEWAWRYFKHAHNNEKFSSRQADDLAFHWVSESVYRLSMHNLILLQIVRI